MGSSISERLHISSLNVDSGIIKTLKIKAKYYREFSGQNTYLKILAAIFIECYMSPLLKLYVENYFQKRKELLMSSGFILIMLNNQSLEQEALKTSRLKDEIFLKPLIELIKTIIDYKETSNNSFLYVYFQRFAEAFSIGISLLSCRNTFSITKEFFPFAGIKFFILCTKTNEILLYPREITESKDMAEPHQILLFNQAQQIHIKKVCKAGKNADEITAEKMVETYNAVMCLYKEVGDMMVCEVCESKVDVVKLPCGHEVCFKDMLNHSIKKKHQLYNCLICPVCNAFGTRDTTLHFYEKYKNNCFNCKRLMNETRLYMFSIDDYCSHLCIRCFLEFSFEKKCGLCHKEYNNQLFSYLKAYKQQCNACKCSKKIYKIMIQSFCSCCDAVCYKCALTAYDKKRCFCNKNLEDEILEKINNEAYKQCFYNDEKYSRIIKLEGKSCDCKACNECQLNFSTTNCLCGNEFPIKIISFLESLNNSYQKNITLAECSICQQNFNFDKTNFLSCKHVFCSSCFEKNVELALSNNDLKSAIKCMQCPVQYNIWELENIISKPLFSRLDELFINKNMRVAQCRNCLEIGIAEEQSIICNKCNKMFCSYCQEDWTIGHTCEDYINKLISVLDKANENYTQCPGCRIPYNKDESCEIVTCKNDGCKAKFCFSCACFMSPVFAHGNYYHRPNCRFYDNRISEEAKNTFKFEKNCDQCNKSGTLCSPPILLKNPRKIGIDEVINKSSNENSDFSDQESDQESDEYH
ncbi:hypothetical protein SteCoe_34710 [Stentor coeruleus]|uniref:RING-type domain-containing protein n=1 Tax=Stentor coeruleus TaxID=5963 RepID=A0A1R2AU17_9CILI|nr:hypothetical protein SteCoe_34710 [Stentor coeruleus]